jgi:hypothetical protein
VKKILEDKTMEKASSTMIVVLVIGALIGAAGAYYYVQPQLTQKYDAGYAAGKAATPTTAAIAPDLAITTAPDPISLDFTAAIDANGDVVDDTPIDFDVTVVNDGDTAATVMMALTNPLTAAKGLDTDLVFKYTHVTFDWNGITDIPLYKEAYSDPFTLGTLPPGASVTFTVRMWFDLNTKGDYTDGESYDNTLFIYGANAPSVEEIDFTVLT